jgi:hypothetical protein
MAYNISKNARLLGDIKYENDPDTQIDFDSNSITFKTDDTGRLYITNSHISSSLIMSASVYYGDGRFLQNVTGSGLAGPGSSTDDAVVRFDGAAGDTLQNSTVIIDDSGNTSGIINLTATGVVSTTGNISSSATVAGLALNTVETVVNATHVSSSLNISGSEFHGDGSWLQGVTGSGGDVSGPGSAADNAIVRFDGAGGKTLQNSAATINDSGVITTTGNISSSATVAGLALTTVETVINATHVSSSLNLSASAFYGDGGNLTNAGTNDHAALSTNLAWLTSGHAGTTDTICGFNTDGEAEFLPWTMPDQARRTEYWFVGAGNKVSTNSYTNVTTTGTLASSPDSDGWLVEFKSKTSGDFKTSCAQSSDNFCTTEGNPGFDVRIKTGADIDAFRWWIIFTDGPGSSHAADEPSRKYAGVRFNPTDGDTKFEIHARDGTTAATPQEVDVTPAANTVYLIKCSVLEDAGEIVVDINGTSATLSTENLPDAAEPLGFAILMYAEDGSNRRVYLMNSARLTAK